MRTAIVSACSLALIIVAACSSSNDTTPGTSGGSTTGGGSSTTGGGGGTTSSGATTGGGQTQTDGGDTNPAVTAARACGDLADAFCAKLERCSTFALSVTYGDNTTCKTRFTLGCIPSFTAPGTSATPEKTATCAASVGALTCDSVLAGNLGAACTATPGTLANGTSCNEDAQCASTFCAHAASSACGVCSAVTAAGAACVNESCSRGTVCPKGATKCITPVRGAVGASCTVQEQCDLANAVGCNTLTSKCIQLSASGTGESCGLSGSTFKVCAASGSCSSSLGGTCKAAAADGAACSDADTGPHCLSPARCVGGTCKVTDPTACK